MILWVYWDDKFYQKGQPKPIGNKTPKYIIGVKAVLQFNHLQGLQSGKIAKIPEVEVAQLPTGPHLAVDVSEAASMKAQKTLCLHLSTPGC